MSCIALATKRHDVLLVPLENPLQTPAFDYGHALQSQEPEVRPGDGRCRRRLRDDLRLGHGQHHGLGDAARRRHPRPDRQTLDNIAALISGDNLRRHGLPGFGATLDDLALVRVYVKRQEDYPAVREVCRARLGEVPTIYADRRRMPARTAGRDRGHRLHLPEGRMVRPGKERRKDPPGLRRVVVRRLYSRPPLRCAIDFELPQRGYVRPAQGIALGRWASTEKSCRPNGPIILSGERLGRWPDRTGPSHGFAWAG